MSNASLGNEYVEYVDSIFGKDDRLKKTALQFKDHAERTLEELGKSLGGGRSALADNSLTGYISGVNHKFRSCPLRKDGKRITFSISKGRDTYSLHEAVETDDLANGIKFWKFLFSHCPSAEGRLLVATAPRLFFRKNNLYLRDIRINNSELEAKKDWEISTLLKGEPIEPVQQYLSTAEVEASYAMLSYFSGFNIQADGKVFERGIEKGYRAFIVIGSVFGDQGVALPSNLEFSLDKQGHILNGKMKFKDNWGSKEHHYALVSSWVQGSIRYFVINSASGAASEGVVTVLTTEDTLSVLLAHPPDDLNPWQALFKVEVSLDSGRKRFRRVSRVFISRKIAEGGEKCIVEGADVFPVPVKKTVPES